MGLKQSQSYLEMRIDSLRKALMQYENFLARQGQEFSTDPVWKTLYDLIRENVEDLRTLRG